MRKDSKGLNKFLARFNTEADCVDFLFQIKWPNGYCCSRCSHRHAYKITTRRLPLYECATCRHQTSPTVGTVMEGSRTELRKWFLALFLVADYRRGINAVELSRRIQVTYKTAWLMLHKIRHSMGQADTAIMLSGFVQVNSACYGRPYNPSICRHPKEYPLLIGASVNDRNEPVYVKMKLVPENHMREKKILPLGTDVFAKQHIKLGSHVVFTIKRYVPNRLKPLLPIFAESNKWINNTFHGLGPRHLQAYLNEFCYRLNQRFKNQQIFERLVHLCATSRAISYSDLTASFNQPVRKQKSA